MTTGLLKGNCLEQLLLIPDNSVDSVVTDPPYELNFMNKGWDASGIAYNVAVWEQCFRVLKPGGHLLAFGGTRTYHRIAVAIEDAGFEVRDSIHWTYGSGFPKSMNISKAIDKKAGAERTEVVGTRSRNVKPFDDENGWNANSTTGTYEYKAPATDDARKWQGWGTALKPSHEPVVVARKPVVGTVANNVLTYGTGALNIDGSRVAHQSEADRASATPQGKVTSNLKAGSAPDVNDEGRKDVERPDTSLGRWPANTILTHSPDCRQVGTKSETIITTNGKGFAGSFEGGENNNGGAVTESTTAIWNCVEGCPALELDTQSGIRPGGTFPAVRGRSEIGAFGAGGTHKDKPNQARTMNDNGGASRFFTNTEYDEIDFPPFIYQAKASSRERSEGLGDLETKQTVGGGGLTDVGDKYGSIKAPAKNFHPTVKPVSLMRHLVRLVTPRGGLVLDPFLGSGTTAVAALLENCQWVGCELTEDYWPIIEGRTAWAQTQVEKPATTMERLF